MRCSCRNCGTYMIQPDDLILGCVCPDCGERCTACLGTNSVVSREMLKNLASDPAFLNEIFGEPEIPLRPGRSETDEYLD